MLNTALQLHFIAVHFRWIAVLCSALQCHFITVQCECICSGAVTAADQNSTWFLALGVAELPHDQDLDHHHHHHHHHH